jgi:hypothetical protein
MPDKGNTWEYPALFKVVPGIWGIKPACQGPLPLSLSLQAQLKPETTALPQSNHVTQPICFIVRPLCLLELLVARIPVGTTI